MYRGYLKYFAGFFITIGLIIVLIVLIFGGSDKSTPSTTTNSNAPKSLSSIADTDDQVRMTIAGKIQSNQEYREIQITVDRNNANLDIINGYEGQVVESKNFASNQSAYESFLKSLGKAGYMQGDNSEELADDRGYCPLGQRFIFEIIENGEVVQRFWSTNCGKSYTKTYLGNASLTVTLFQNQIPDYFELTNNIYN